MTCEREDVKLAGIDFGSTTAKFVLVNNNNEIIFSKYKRHRGRIVETLREMLHELKSQIGDIEIDLKITGSAGMGLSERLNIPFVQEVVASGYYIKTNFPFVKTFIEIGGEDSKIIFFDEMGRPDIRMNGSCAGGTGAFIDQMATLLNVDIQELETLAEHSENIYPIASRCGVFAKTDVQALLSRHVSKEDVAASIFNAVAVQVITALARGKEIKRKVLFGGGPLTFFPYLRKAFVNLLQIDSIDDVIVPPHPELIPAIGTAIIDDQHFKIKISNLINLLKNKAKVNQSKSDNLQPLFNSKEEFHSWGKRFQKYKIPEIDIKQIRNKNLFLGIDSGSTTTKIVVIDEEGKLCFTYYKNSGGDPIKTVRDGLSKFFESAREKGVIPEIKRTAVTGYGEGLIKAAFGIDDGIVETLAHYKAAQFFEPNVSFILDIGGQDMKAIYIKDGAISEIQVNEACSSGCGSFIETFAYSLGYNVKDFAKIACFSKAPVDLGTRCTVFMNSKVKQALREGRDVSDIAAGLAYSVIKNALYKVLKLKDVNTLGENIVVQGGTFKNPAVLRALELLIGRDVIKPEISELMGAYGAALSALKKFKKLNTQYKEKNFDLENIDKDCNFTKKEIKCKGCENRCSVIKLTFNNGNIFYTGNRCERYFSNNLNSDKKGTNLIDEQLKLLFNRNTEPKEKAILTYGIPRCLNMYENFPFWCEFLTSCGFKVVVSSESNFKLYLKGSPTVMSENVCFPAKLAHGHIFDLIEKKVDRIFFPIVVFEQEEFKDSVNSFNCPVVTGYPDLIKSAINPEKKFGIPVDSPAISFKNKTLLIGQLYKFFKKYGIKYTTIINAVEKGLNAQVKYKEKLKELAKTLLKKAEKNNEITVILAGRPYHTDPLVNHGIPNLLVAMGVNVLSETAIPIDLKDVSLKDVNVLTQWTYSNRLYAAAKWLKDKKNVELVQLTSFGCGPDAITTDEVREIVSKNGKIYTLIKMDEITNLGAVKIRLRSLIDSVKERTNNLELEVKKKSKNLSTNKNVATNKKSNYKKTLITPYFSPLYSPLITPILKSLGYRLDVLEPQDRVSVEWGLKLVNNDICYPAILVAGDIMKAFKSGKYKPEDTAVILTQTGGQCRASNYVSLVRKGLYAFGLKDVEIISVSNDDVDCPKWFEVDKIEFVKKAALAIIFADPLAKMYLSTKVREKIPGTAEKLHRMYLKKMEKGLENGDYDYLLNLLEKAVDDFNNLEIKSGVFPKIGVVGEIFVNYNFFSNGNIVEWLSLQGVEVILPPIQSFFTQRFINETYDQKAYFKRSFIDLIKHRILELYTKYHLSKIEKVMQKFKFYQKTPGLRELADATEEILSLANQYGEGWLLTAEMIAMLKTGINNIICLQPFGCISNHITGKGIVNKLKDRYPQMNFLALDLDAGTSEVNLLNRLYFMINTAFEEATISDSNHTSTRSRDRSFFLSLPSINLTELEYINDYANLEFEKWKAWVSKLGLWEKAKSVKKIGFKVIGKK